MLPELELLMLDDIHLYDAILDDWFLIAALRSGCRSLELIGTVWADRQGRFRDGRMIRTSALRSGNQKLASGALVHTLNSTYLLGKPLSLRASVIH